MASKETTTQQPPKGSDSLAGHEKTGYDKLPPPPPAPAYDKLKPPPEKKGS